MAGALSNGVAIGGNLARLTGYIRAFGDVSFKKLLRGRMSVQEFCLTILDMLSSKRSAEELQTELFDLCGFERFEMITSLLEHRDDLAKSLKDSRAIMKKEIATAAASLPEHVDAVTRGPPVFGCRVTVQSEDERLLKKQMRKEEKKINKLVSQAVDDEEEEEFHFDPVDLRMKRQAALANAMTTPLFKERERVREMTPTVEQFPYVFDNMSKAKATTDFIASTKMSLPAGFERQDNKKYEEVTMPVVAQEPVNVKKLVQISSLDEVGQMAFGGIKSLNRMQSVVYDSAYRTNENLLVCAPTGAGKTNNQEPHGQRCAQECRVQDCLCGAHESSRRGNGCWLWKTAGAFRCGCAGADGRHATHQDGDRQHSNARDYSGEVGRRHEKTGGRGIGGAGQAHHH